MGTPQGSPMGMPKATEKVRQPATPKATARVSALALPAIASASFPAGLVTRGHLVIAVLVFAALAVRALFVLRSPVKRCHCLPGFSRARCRRCRATGWKRRRGATAVHRFYWSVRGSAVLEKRRGQLDALREKFNA